MQVRDILKDLKRLKKRIKYTQAFLEKWDEEFGPDRFPLVRRAIQLQEKDFLQRVELYKQLEIVEDEEILKKLASPVVLENVITQGTKGVSESQRRKVEEEIEMESEEDEEDFDESSFESDYEEESDLEEEEDWEEESEDEEEEEEELDEESLEIEEVRKKAEKKTTRKLPFLKRRKR